MPTAWNIRIRRPFPKVRFSFRLRRLRVVVVFSVGINFMLSPVVLVLVQVEFVRVRDHVEERARNDEDAQNTCGEGGEKSMRYSLSLSLSPSLLSIRTKDAEDPFRRVQRPAFSYFPAAVFPIFLRHADVPAPSLASTPRPQPDLMRARR